jgi:DNA polymerase-3 subunit epsilon
MCISGIGELVEFVVLDFETASFSRTSPVEIGLVRFSKGVPVAEFSSLIKPPRGEQFDPMSISLHGITRDDVQDAPEFIDIYENVLSFIGSSLVVAHNASFDLAVLFSTAAHYGLPMPKLTKSLCTKELARKQLPTLKDTLEDACNFFSIENTQAHRAISDCVATGYLAISISEYINQDLDKFAIDVKLNLSTKTALLTQSPARKLPEKALRKSEAKAIAQTLEKTSEIQPLQGQEVILSGTFRNFGKQEGQMLVLKAGGSTGDNLSKKTAFLVSSDPKANNSKHKKARELQAKGSKVEIIDEDRFLELLGQIWVKHQSKS